MTNSLLSSLLPSNYCLFQYYRRPKLSRGGDIAIINHNFIHHTATTILSFSSFECIGSVITSFNSSFKLLVVYRPPSLPIASFYTEFESLLELQIASNIDLFFIEDFNIHIEDLNDYNARHFLKLLNTFDLPQHVTCPTHDSGHIIDLVLTNASSKFIICSFMFDMHISDHKTICIDLDLSKPTVHKTTFSCRQLKKNDNSEFNKDMAAAFSNVENLDLDSLV